MINEQDKAVAAYLDEIEVKGEINLYKASHNKDNWACDWWRVTFDGIAFDYYTGIGHRITKGETPNGFKVLSSKQQAEAKRLAKLWKRDKLGQLIKPTGEKVALNGSRKVCDQRETVTIPPTQASVLYCLLLDRSALDCTFRDWCADFGYDNDSRKAHQLYLDCQEEADKVRDIFNREQLEQLDKLLEDY